jgi:methionyl-tRNA formyltransferase
MRSLRIIFMGTPQFAVPSLEVLVKHGYDLVAVITAPDKPKGRGRELAASPVKECAEANGIPVLQPKNLKSPQFIEELQCYRANLQVVVAFRMLPEVVWSMPQYGTFNLHASLLPKYRGAAPIHWAIINGEKETGITTFLLKHEIDTGGIILQETEPIYETDTTGSLSGRLMKKGAGLVLKTVQLIASGNCKLIPQDLSLDVPKAPKLFKENCKIDWDQDADKIANFIRGLNPFPSAWTDIGGTVYKIHAAGIAKNKELP